MTRRILKSLAAATLLLCGVWWTTRPFDPKAAMVLEAQWDRPKSLARLFRQCDKFG